jgi:thiamine-phosphate pyrophosphorylase
VSRAEARPVRGLYPIVDFDACADRGVEPLDLARVVLDAAPTLVQLRAKHTGARELLLALDALVRPAQERGVTLVVNDRPDLAALCGAPAVHVGQDDLSPADVRRFDPALAVGVSTHTLDQLDRALLEAPAYVAFGPVFTTTSKERPDGVVGLELLARAHERARRANVPLVAIGGIECGRVAAVRPHCEAIAVISALFEGGTSSRQLGDHVNRLVERHA